jgi:voltage-gated potassium channel
MVSALFIFSIEPESFDNFFEAIYWATTALTTVGYGDVYPITVGGRMISMISSFFGIAIVALPSGVITAGFINEMKNDVERKNGDIKD